MIIADHIEKIIRCGNGDEIEIDGKFYLVTRCGNNVTLEELSVIRHIDINFEVTK